MAKGPVAPCALCGETAQLQNSHVISEFLYKGLYDNNHRFPLVEADPLKRASPPLQKGIREYLLCFACEQRLSGWERYASGVFRQLLGSSRLREGPTTFSLTGIQYEPFRLFLLSLLWRLNATSHRIRGDIELAADAEIIRQILLYGHAPDPNQYPCAIVALLLEENGAFSPQLILPPSTTDQGEFRIVRVVISGFLFLFFVPAEDPPTNVAKFLDRDGTLWIDVLPERTFKFVLDTRRKIGAAEMLRGVHRVRNDLIRSGHADPDAPLTLEIVEPVQGDREHEHREERTS